MKHWLRAGVVVLAATSLSVAAAEGTGADAPAMDHGAMGEMENGSMQGGEAPADARDPHAYAEGADFGAIPRPRLADEHRFGSLLIDRLESVWSRDGNGVDYDVQAWYGRDYDRLVFKAEGEADHGRLQKGRTELLWGHAIASYWDTQLGVRQDSGVDPDRGWLAFGVQGLAPYWFEVDATAYVGEGGRTAARFDAEYELLLTQKLILQPHIEANLYGRRDKAQGIGSGLSEVAAGLRLRYEITRQFAPYLGVEWAGKFGETRDLAQEAGEHAEETGLVAGLRMWF